MPINPDAVGFEGQPVHHAWTSKDAILYALGVGCGAQDPAQELESWSELLKELMGQKTGVS